MSNAGGVASAAGAGAANWKSELKEVGTELARMGLALAATVVASKIVWYYVNPYKEEERKAEEQRKFAESRLGVCLPEA